MFVRKKGEAASRKSGSAAKPGKKWIYWDILEFLDPYVQEASTDSNVAPVAPETSEIDNVTDTLSTADSQSQMDFSDEENPQSPSVSLENERDVTQTRQESLSKQATNTAPRPPKRKGGSDQMTEFESSFVELAKAQSDRLESKKERHPMEVFFESCGLRAKQFSRAKQGWLQMQISILMYNAEFMAENAFQDAPMAQTSNHGFPAFEQPRTMPSYVTMQSAAPASSAALQ